MELDTTRRADRRLDLVYRIGAGFTGLVLMGFGIAGLMVRLPLFDTQGEVIAGLSTNGALSFLSIAIGSLLVGAAVLGGKFASTVCITVGVAFVVSGLVNLYLMSTDFNILAFSMPNVIFSFLVGLVVMTFGMYGRFSSHLPEDNPFQRHRHPDEPFGGGREVSAVESQPDGTTEEADQAREHGATRLHGPRGSAHGVPEQRTGDVREGSSRENRG
ncbi:DUF4383 domain-containing protein [Nocardiopsis ganjiahuensis]|uniref:DUF4383 domain-containing protein n=1 Tax=Nocardiopsis ganjiahuensis TaxID=239984 RepID=UPI000348B559|nr:DUF4383 domain-containing protein [Nocardiopsis ganjiahuensis]